LEAGFPLFPYPIFEFFIFDPILEPIMLPEAVLGLSDETLAYYFSNLILSMFCWFSISFLTF